MKSRPAALRHPAGGMTSNGHDQTAGSMETSQPAERTNRTVSLMHGKHQRSSRERMLATVLVGRPRLTALNAEFAPEAVVCGLARSSSVASV